MTERAAAVARVERSMSADGEAAVRVRRIHFDDAFADLPRHFMGGDLVMSHVLAVLSSLFPDGEDFFVRSVRRLARHVEDPDLAREVRGFIGQEAIHGREHRAFNRRLAELGYPTRGIERMTDRLLRTVERLRPAKANLAVTVALEHYTATLAELLLESEQARDVFGDEGPVDLLLWHALEESEHKAVAFDAYRAVGGGDLLRRATMNLVTVNFIAIVVGATTVSVLRDPASRDLRRLFRSLADLRHSPWLTRDAFRRLRAYNRPGFHPDDRDATALVEAWRSELFGTEGRLRTRLAA